MPVDVTEGQNSGRGNCLVALLSDRRSILGHYDVALRHTRLHWGIQVIIKREVGRYENDSAAGAAAVPSDSDDKEPRFHTSDVERPGVP